MTTETVTKPFTVTVAFDHNAAPCFDQFAEILKNRPASNLLVRTPPAFKGRKSEKSATDYYFARILQTWAKEHGHTMIEHASSDFQVLILESDAVIAVWNGENKNTQFAVRSAKYNRKPLRVINSDKQTPTPAQRAEYVAKRTFLHDTTSAIRLRIYAEATLELAQVKHSHALICYLGTDDSLFDEKSEYENGILDNVLESLEFCLSLAIEEVAEAEAALPADPLDLDFYEPTPQPVRCTPSKLGAVVCFPLPIDEPLEFSLDEVYDLIEEEQQEEKEQQYDLDAFHPESFDWSPTDEVPDEDREAVTDAENAEAATEQDKTREALATVADRITITGTYKIDPMNPPDNFVYVAGTYTQIAKECACVWHGSPLANRNFVNRNNASKLEVMARSKAAVTAYKRDLWQDIQKRGPMFAEVLRLAKLIASGETLTLGCWCEGNCHAEVIKSAILSFARLIEEAREIKAATTPDALLNSTEAGKYPPAVVIAVIDAV